MFVVFNLDGTLSDPTHRNLAFACPERGAPHLRADMTPADWDAYSLLSAGDGLVFPMQQVARSLYYVGQRVEIWTGRGAVASVSTQAWLRKQGVPYHALRMRPIGNTQHDYELKRDWMLAHGKPDPVFEDRARVVEMWRSHGVPCAQVAPGNF